MLTTVEYLITPPRNAQSYYSNTLATTHNTLDAFHSHKTPDLIFLCTICWCLVR